MVKKYLIRVIGALCILGAVVLMFLPGWIQLEDVSSRDLRDIREDAVGICDTISESFLNQLERYDDFKEELKDYDLPYTKGKLKARFKEISGLAEDALDDTVSLHELMLLAVKAPGILADIENILDSGVSSTCFNAVAYYVMYEGSQRQYYQSNYVEQTYVKTFYEDLTQDTVDVVGDFAFVCPLLAGLLVLIIALAVLSAVTHICNKGRWVKYLFLVLLVLFVAGTCTAIILTSDMLSEVVEAAPAFEDMTLSMTVTPFLAVVLMIVPIVLDIIFERKKKKNIYVEGYNNYGKQYQ